MFLLTSFYFRIFSFWFFRCK